MLSLQQLHDKSLEEKKYFGENFCGEFSELFLIFLNSSRILIESYGKKFFQSSQSQSLFTGKLIGWACLERKYGKEKLFPHDLLNYDLLGLAVETEKLN